MLVVTVEEDKYTLLEKRVTTMLTLLQQQDKLHQLNLWRKGKKVVITTADGDC